MFKFLRKTALWMIAVPILFSLLGAASNQLVLIANNDTFPVRVNLVKAKEFTGDEATVLKDGTIMLDDTHCLMTDKTHLNLLADTFDMHDKIESIGDMGIDFGNFLWPFAFPMWLITIIGKTHEE